MNLDQRLYEWGVADDRATMAMAMAMRDPNPIHHAFSGAPSIPPIVQGPVVWGAAMEAAARWYPQASLQSASARFIAPVHTGQILIARELDRAGGAKPSSGPATVRYEVHTKDCVQPVATGDFVLRSEGE